VIRRTAHVIPVLAGHTVRLKKLGMVAGGCRREVLLLVGRKMRMRVFELRRCDDFLPGRLLACLSCAGVPRCVSTRTLSSSEYGISLASVKGTGDECKVMCKLLQ
jgi:hypothetical protein